MKKPEAEKGIRYLCSVWGKETGTTPDPAASPDFSGFYSWVKQNYPEYLKFRSVMPVSEEVERWFDQEFKQTWRN